MGKLLTFGGLALFALFMAAVSAQGIPTVKINGYSVRNAIAGKPLRTFSAASMIDAAAFAWPSGIVHKSTITRLIECESGWANVHALDTDGIYSDGILQFHEDGTWNAMSRLSGITGSPMNPTDAIRMADWMISNGYLGRWTCAHILGMVQ